MVQLISLPESFADAFEEFIQTREDVTIECVGTGCGSTQYEVESENVANTLSAFGDWLKGIVENSLIEHDEDNE